VYLSNSCSVAAAIWVSTIVIIIIIMASKINTENVFRDKELDQGFILRANEEVSKQLKQVISGDVKQEKGSMSITLLD
jgi:hypothetical protein